MIGAKPLVMKLDLVWQLIWLLCVFIICDVIGCAIQFWLILANKTSKKWLVALVGYEYVVSCVGEKVFLKSVKPLIVAATVDVALQVAQTEINSHAADRYIDKCEKANVPVDSNHRQGSNHS